MRCKLEQLLFAGIGYFIGLYLPTVLIKLRKRSSLLDCSLAVYQKGKHKRQQDIQDKHMSNEDFQERH
jgi:hypothetical protein